MKPNNNHNFLFILMLTISFLLVSIFSVSADGCFTLKESDLYCKNINIEQAKAECTLFADCQFDNVFIENKNCFIEKDFPECKKVFCKSSCKFEVKGKCSSGEIPPGEEAKWCSSGCCQFNYSNKKYCDYKMSQWLCELESKNHNVFDFNYDSKILQGECLNLCNQKEETISQNNGDNNKQNENKEMLIDMNAFLGGGNQNQEIAKENNEDKSFLVPFLLLILFISGFGYYFYKNGYIGKFSKKKISLNSNKSDESGNRTKSTLLKLINSSFSGKKRSSYKKVKERQNKIKEVKQHEYLDQFGITEKKHNTSYFNRLKNIIKSHQSDEMAKMVKKIPHKKIAPNTAKNNKKQLNENPIDKLRKIIKK